MKYLLIFALLLTIPFRSISQETPTTIEIDKGTSSILKAPFYGYYDYSQFSVIYTVSDMTVAANAAGIDDITNGCTISSLFFEFNDWANNYTTTSLSQTVKMANISSTTTHIERGPTGSGDYSPEPNYNDLSSVSGFSPTFTTVRSNFTFKTVVGSSYGWEEIGANVSGQTTGFTTNFVWDGKSNILVSWENRDGDYTPLGQEGGVRGGNGNSGHNQRAHAWYKDNSYPTAGSTYNLSAPNIKLVVFPSSGFTPLPITLGTFTGIIAAGSENTIQLDWTTQSEKDNDYFTLWRSYDGQTWEDITQLSGAGNSNEVLSYQYMDRNIIPQLIENNSVYYKLSQTDYDGTTEFFHVIPVEVKSAKTHVVYRTNLMGQEVDQHYKGLVLETWNNGAIHKTVHK